VPQYGGYCALAMALDSIADIDPEEWAIVGGKLYLNNGFFAQRLWSIDKSGNIERADRNWPACQSSWFAAADASVRGAIMSALDRQVCFGSRNRSPPTGRPGPPVLRDGCAQALAELLQSDGVRLGLMRIAREETPIGHVRPISLA
jgi:hypothetical protein